MRFVAPTDPTAAPPLSLVVMTTTAQEDIVTRTRDAVRPDTIVCFKKDAGVDFLGFADREAHLRFLPQQKTYLASRRLFGLGSTTSIFFVVPGLPGPFLAYGQGVRLGFVREGRVLGMRVDPSSRRAVLCEYRDGEEFHLTRAVSFEELRRRGRAARRAQTPLYTAYADSFLAMNENSFLSRNK